MNEENNPSDSVPEESLENSSEGAENVSDEAPKKDSPDTAPSKEMIQTEALAVINNATGKNYQTLEAAKEGIKETQAHVGRKLDEEGYASKVEVQKLADEAWYARHPQHEGQKEIIDALRVQTGKDINEVVDMDVYKNTFEKVSGFDKIQGAKTVLETNPRLASSQTSITKAKETLVEAQKAMMAGDNIVAQEKASQAGDDATQAVIDAYELGG